MKKILLFVLFTFSIYSYGQEYTPLLDNYNEWNFTYCYTGCYTDIYYTDGDTIVDGLDYKILDGYHYISRGFLLREDIPERKVYLNLLLNNTSTEYLLYDFSLAVGDSIDMKNPITPFPENAGYYTLDSIVPRPLVDGNEYRHFYFTPSESNTVSFNKATWIEGAGSLSIITAPSGHVDINKVGHLSCFYKEGVSFYTNLDSIDACEPTIILNTDAFHSPFSDVIISTQSSTNQLLLMNVANARFIDLYDLNGKRLQSYTNLGSKDLIVNTSDLSSGIYMILMQTKDLKKKAFKVVIE